MRTTLVLNVKHRFAIQSLPQIAQPVVETVFVSRVIHVFATKVIILNNVTISTAMVYLLQILVYVLVMEHAPNQTLAFAKLDG